MDAFPGDPHLYDDGFVGGVIPIRSYSQYKISPGSSEVNLTPSFFREIVLFEDNHLLVVNKPAGILTQGDATGDLDLHSAAKAYIKAAYNKPGAVFLGLVHRLDRPVSGAMVFARTSKAASRLTRQFKVRSVDKRYIAMVEGRMEGQGTLVNYVRKDHRKVRVVPEGHPKGLRAELSYNVLAQIGKTSLVDIKLATGRPHQIRVQLANHGYSIVGDFKYGGKSELDGRNLALHSYSLEIEHPTQNISMKWRVMPPETWGATYWQTIADLIER